MEHSVHVASKHFVEAVAPASLAAIRQKVKTAFGGLEGDDDDNEDEDFTAGDALGKALALVKQV